MTRGVDLSGLSPAERTIAAAGALLFLDGFIPWWYRIKTPARTYLHNAGLTGWGLLAVLAGFVAAGIVVTRTVGRTPRFRADFALYTGLGLLALGALVVQARLSATEWIGYWVALVASVTIVTGGLRRRTERRSGWV